MVDKFIKNEFFDTETFPEEIIAFEEELTDAITRKPIGNRRVSFPNRPLGGKGWIEYDLTADVEVKKGFKTFTLKASPEKPRRVLGMLIVLSGRRKENFK